MGYEELVAALYEPSTRHVVAAQLRDALPDSLPALLAGLRDGPASVRRWSAHVLDHADHDDGVEDALVAAARDRNRHVRRAALHALACAACKPDGRLTTDGVAFLVEAMLHDPSVEVRRSCAGNLMLGQQGRPDLLTEAFDGLVTDACAGPELWGRAVVYRSGWGVVGCPACDLHRGRAPLPGGIVHATRHWLVSHCLGPLGVGTLVVTTARHVVRLADLTPDEAAELGPLLAATARVVTTATDAVQVYACLWSHGPGHIHFVVQPEPAGEGGPHGPALQAAQFEHGEPPDPVAIEEFARRARGLYDL